MAAADTTAWGDNPKCRCTCLNWGSSKGVIDVVHGQSQPQSPSSAHDPSHVASFQKLLSSFDEGDNALRIVTTLNSMLQSIVSAVVTDIDNAKIAREASVHAITLFVHGVQEVATEVQSPALSALLNDLSHRILQLDKFVRGYFILETLELDQVVASLEDSLDQAYVRVQALQDELKAMVHTHKRKIAEAKLMAIIHDATAANAGHHQALTEPPSSSASKSQLFSSHSLTPTNMTSSPTDTGATAAPAYTFASTDEDVYDVNARLTREVSELTNALSETQAQLDMLKADVDMLGDATFRDRHVQRLTDELACERNRVKALEMEMLDLRVKQADLAKGVLQKHSLFRVDRSICGQEAHASAAMSTDSSADEAPLLPSADDKVATPHSSLLPAVQRARHTFKVMVNLDIKLSDMLSPPKKRSLSATARVTQAVVKLKAKLQHKTLVDSAPVPVELVELRRRMNVLYDRKRQLDECAALASSHPRPGPSLTFAELVLGWFVAKYSTLQDAESVGCLVWFMEEFLHGKHPDEVVSFYLWVVQGVRDIHIGARCPITATDTHPQFICKFKASLLTRTIFRVLHFRTCGFGSTDRGTAVARDDTLEVMADCGRLFAAAAAGGPMYLGEFHAILDQFVTKGNGENDEMYPLDVYLYLLVLLFKKQNEWHVAHLVEQFRHHAADAHKEEMRRQAALLAAPKNRGSNPDNKPKKKKKASALSKGAMTKEVFGAFVAKLDLVRSLGDIQEVTALVVRSRREYDSGGITSDAFIAAAHANHWFALEFATRMSLRHELHDVTDDHDKATRQLASTWNLHLSRLTIHGECDKNVFVSRYVVQLRQRVTLALHDQKTLSHKSNPHTILALCRELLRFSWQLAVLRSHGNGFTKPDDDDDDATDVMSVSTLDMTRSSELILITKGVCSLPAADGSYKPSDGSIDLEHGVDDLHPFTCIHMANVGDLFPHGTPTSMQSSESVELHRILQRYAWHVCEVYRSYSLVCNATTFGLTFAAFQELVHDLAIVTPHCTIVHLNAVYQHVVSSNIILDNRTDQHTMPQTEDKVMNDTFVELLLRLAVERHTREGRVAMPSPTQADDDRRISRIFDHFVTEYLLPNVCQAANHTFRQEVAALDVQRLLLHHRRFLRRVFLHYAKQDALDVERSKMNFGEFQTFVSEFQLNDDALFPPAMTLLVFNAVQDDVDERQCVFHEFTTAIVAIAQMKNNNPFLKWRRKADEFIGRLLDFAHANLHLMSTALFSRHLLTHVEGPQEAEGMLFRYVATLAISSGMT
ncbi:hypothetical protein DYB34_011230, partial [Aphanomyces astaci]